MLRGKPGISGDKRAKNQGRQTTDSKSGNLLRPTFTKTRIDKKGVTVPSLFDRLEHAILWAFSGFLPPRAAHRKQLRNLKILM